MHSCWFKVWDPNNFSIFSHTVVIVQIGQTDQLRSRSGFICPNKAVQHHLWCHFVTNETGNGFCGKKRGTEQLSGYIKSASSTRLRQCLASTGQCKAIMFLDETRNKSWTQELFTWFFCTHTLRRVRLCISCGVVCQLVVALGCLLSAVIDGCQTWVQEVPACRVSWFHDSLPATWCCTFSLIFYYKLGTNIPLREGCLRGSNLANGEGCHLAAKTARELETIPFFRAILLKRSAIDIFNQKTEEKTILPQNSILSHRSCTCVFSPRPSPFKNPQKIITSQPQESVLALFIRFSHQVRVSKNCFTFIFIWFSLASIRFGFERLASLESLPWFSTPLELLEQTGKRWKEGMRFLGQIDNKTMVKQKRKTIARWMQRGLGGHLLRAMCSRRCGTRHCVSESWM